MELPVGDSLRRPPLETFEYFARVNIHVRSTWIFGVFEGFGRLQPFRERGELGVFHTLGTLKITTEESKSDENEESFNNKKNLLDDFINLPYCFFSLS